MNATPKKPGSWFRTLAIIAGAAVLLLVVVAVVVPLLIPWEKLRPEAENKLTETLQHRVSIGTLGFNLFRGIEVRRVRIANARGFSREPLLSDEAMVVKYRLLPLLWGQVMIKAVLLDRPEVRIERAADGRFNFSDMLPAKTAAVPQPTPQAGPAKKSFSLPLSVLVSRIQIKNASLAFIDRKARQTYAVRDFNLDLQNLTLTGLTPAKLTLSARLQAMGQTLPVTAEGEWRLRLAQAEVLLDRFQAGFPGLALNVKGKVSNLFDAQTADLSGSLALDAAKLLATAKPFAAGKLPADLSLTGQGEVRFQVQGPAADVAGLKVSVQDTLQIQAGAAGLNVPVGADGRLDVAQGNLKFSQKVTVPSGQADVNAALAKFLTARSLDAKLEVRCNLTEAMAKLVPPSQAQKVAALKLAGRVDVRAAVTGPLSDPKHMDLSAQIKTEQVSVHYEGKPVVEKLSTVLSVLPKQVSVKDLRMDLAGQPFAASFNAQGFDLRDPETLKPEHLQAQVDWTIKSKLLDVDAFLALIPKKPAAPAAAQPATVSDLPEPDARTLLPAGLKMRGVAEAGGLKFGTVKLGAINLLTTIQKRQVKVDAGLLGYQGSVKTKTQLDFSKSLLGYTIDAETKTVDLEPLLNDVVDTFVAAKLKKPEVIAQIKDKLTGKLSGKMQLAGAGMRTVNAKPRLTGHGAFTLADGRLRQFPFQENLAKWFGSEKFKQDIPFDHTVVEFTLGQQEVKVTKFLAESGPQGESGDVRMTAEGRLTFDAEFRDFRLRPSLNPRAQGSLSPEFRQYTEVLKDDRGWVTIPVVLNGPMKKPDTQPDWDWIKKQLGGYVQKKAKAAASEAGNKLQKFFQNQQGQSTDQTKQNAGQELEKAKEKLKDFNLNNLFK